jgi:hypothetical protein
MAGTVLISHSLTMTNAQIKASSGTNAPY